MQEEFVSSWIGMRIIGHRYEELFESGQDVAWSGYSKDYLW